MAFDEDYPDTVTAATVAANLIGPRDLPRVLRAIDGALKEGPKMHTPHWTAEKAQALRDAKELLEAAMPLWELAHRRRKLLQEKGAG